MEDKLMDLLARWPGNVQFGGKNIEIKDELNAELEQRRKELALQSGDGGQND